MPYGILNPHTSTNAKVARCWIPLMFHAAVNRPEIASCQFTRGVQACTCEIAWETGPLAAASASLTGSGRLAEAASAAELAAPAVALMLSCSRCLLQGALEGTGHTTTEHHCAEPNTIQAALPGYFPHADMAYSTLTKSKVGEMGCASPVESL